MKHMIDASVPGGQRHMCRLFLHFFGFVQCSMRNVSNKLHLDEVRTRSPSSESNMVPLRCQILLESHFASRCPRLIQELVVAEVGEN